MDYKKQKAFDILENFGVDLIDRTLLASSAEHMNLIFSIKSLESPKTDFSFFEKNVYLYDMIQSGEYLSISHIDVNKPFIAYRKAPNLVGEHELLYYSPQSSKKN